MYVALRPVSSTCGTDAGDAFLAPALDDYLYAIFSAEQIVPTRALLHISIVCLRVKAELLNIGDIISVM